MHLSQAVKLVVADQRLSYPEFDATEAVEHVRSTIFAVDGDDELSQAYRLVIEKAGSVMVIFTELDPLDETSLYGTHVTVYEFDGTSYVVDDDLTILASVPGSYARRGSKSFLRDDFVADTVKHYMRSKR